MLSRPYWRAFAGGEITGEMFGRIDLDKYQVGLANCENFRVLPHGPAENRPGFEYVLQSGGQVTRVIPFAYSAEQTMVLELSNQKIRFHTQGATLLESGNPLDSMTSANPGVFTIAAHGYTNGQWVFSAGNSLWFLAGRFLIIQNATANTFTLTDLFGTPIDSTGQVALPFMGISFARVYEIAAPYLEADLFDIHYTQSADVLTLVHPNYDPRELRRLGATNWQLTTITFAPTIAAPGAPALTPIGPGGGTPVNQDYVATSVASETFEESVASPNVVLARDLTVVGNAIDVDPPVVAGAFRYNIYKLKGGLYGYIGSTDGGALRDDNIDPDITQTPPVSYAPFTGAGNFPSAVTYFEQRRCFAATNNKPQNHWLTRSATESNLSQSFPVRDDDAIIFRIAAAQQNRVRHLVPLTDLLSLTVGAEWRITPASGDFLTPAVVPRPQSYVGANNVQPVVTSASCMYVANQGSHLRELSYGGEAKNYGYQSLDASVLAPHLVDYYRLVDLAYSRAPVQTVWAVRDDGVLLGMTYVPEQNVRAWHHHTTQGRFESVCCVAEGGEDVLYAVVSRDIPSAGGGGGYTQPRYIERLHTRKFGVTPEFPLQDAFFVDSGLSANLGGVSTVVSGLWHLEGLTVVALADGAVQPEQVVTNGRVTLQAGAAIVHVGLPYTARMDTLPLVMNGDGYGEGLTKAVNKAHVRVYRGSGMFVGPTDGTLTEAKQRTNEPYGSPPRPITRVVSTNVLGVWVQNAQVTIEQRAPLPLTVLSMALEVSS
jgi:hypothetical protein